MGDSRAEREFSNAFPAEDVLFFLSFLRLLELSHPPKALFFTSASDACFTGVRELQFSKAPLSMTLTLSGKITWGSEVHLANAHLSITMRPSAISRLVREEQSEMLPRRFSGRLGDDHSVQRGAPSERITADNLNTLRNLHFDKSFALTERGGGNFPHIL